MAEGGWGAGKTKSAQAILRGQNCSGMRTSWVTTSAAGGLRHDDEKLSSKWSVTLTSHASPRSHSPKLNGNLAHAARSSVAQTSEKTEKSRGALTPRASVIVREDSVRAVHRDAAVQGVGPRLGQYLDSPIAELVVFGRNGSDRRVLRGSRTRGSWPQVKPSI
jgi:hypothetical protein